MIKISINLSKIDKARLRKDKNENIWGDFILKETTNDKYGNDYSIKQDKKKEEDVQLPFIGNGKHLGGSSRPQQSSSRSSSSNTDDLPI